MLGGQKFSKHNFILLHLSMEPEKRLCNQELSHINATLLLNLVCWQKLEAVMCAGGQRKRRAAPRQRRQATGAGEEEEDVEAEFNPENPYQVSHTNTFFFCLCLHPTTASTTVPSDLRELFQRRVSHSCARSSRCRGHGGAAWIVTADLSVCVGVFSVHAFFCVRLSEPVYAFLSALSLYE